MTNWRLLRAKEGRGFVCKRIIDYIVYESAMMYGTGCMLDCGKFKRVIDPKEFFHREETKAVI